MEYTIPPPIFFSCQEESYYMEQNIEEKRESILDRIADMISRFMIVICILIFAVMVFSVSYGVLGRYLPFIRNPRWTQELQFFVWFGCVFWEPVMQLKKVFMCA